MSYSFSVLASSKDEAREKLVTEFDKLVESQPVHCADRMQAEANANAVLALLPDLNEDEEIRGSVSGYVSWQADQRFNSVNISATFNLAKKA